MAAKTPPITPRFQDKEERRLILCQSLDHLVEFHKVERDEKLRTFTFYTAFLTGALAIVFGIPFLISTRSIDPAATPEIAVIKLISLTVILILTLLVIKKLIASRIGSNNIYTEYARRLEYLVTAHTGDLDDAGKQELTDSLDRYYGKLAPKKKILGKGSSDTYEVYGLWGVSIVLSLASIIPIAEFFLGSFGNIFQYRFTSIMSAEAFRHALPFLLVYFVSCLYVSVFAALGAYIIDSAPSSPGTEID